MKKALSIILAIVLVAVAVLAGVKWNDASKKAGEKHASLASPLYDRVRQLRSDILVHQDALGLTPKGLRKLQGPAQKTGPNAQDTLKELLDNFKEAARG